MRFIETRFKNVLSFGFDEEYVVPYGSSTFNMVFGDNGTGKTNFTKLIEIGLYFEYPENVSDIKNWYAKEDAYIEHIVESNGHMWKIKSVFTKKLKSVTVHKDDELQDWGNPSTVQKKIEEYVVDVPLSIFRNILCSSMDNVSSILRLNAKDSKEIVNQIFDISDIGLVGEYTSKHYFSKNKALSDKNVERETLETNLASQKELFEEFKQNDTKEEEKKLSDLNIQLEKLGKEYNTLDSAVKNVENKIKKIEKLTIESIIESMTNNIESIKIKNDDLNIKSDESKSKSVFYNKIYNQRLLDKCLEDVLNEDAILKGISAEKDAAESDIKGLTKIKENKMIYSLVTTIISELANKEAFDKDCVEKEDEHTLLVDEQTLLIAKKESSEKYEKYYNSLKLVNDEADRIKKILKPDLDGLKLEKISLEDKKEIKDIELNNKRSDLIEHNKHILFMENPRCGVKGCDMDFSSEKNVELLNETISKRDEVQIDIDNLIIEIAELKIKISSIDERIELLKSDLSSSVSFVKSFVKDDSFEDFVISFNDGVDMLAFENKFKIVLNKKKLTGLIK